MRVLFFIPDLRLGGAQRVTINLASGLIDRGHEACILTIGTRIDQYLPENIPVISAGKYRTKLYSFFRRSFQQFISSVDPVEDPDRFDLVISSVSYADRFLKTMGHPRALFHIHGPSSQLMGMNSGVPRLRKWRKRRRFQEAYSGSRLLLVTPGLEADLRDGFGVVPDEVLQFPNVVDDNEIAKLSRCGAPDMPKEPYYINVGRIVPGKRHDLLLEGFRRSGTDRKLVILGGDPRDLSDMVARMDLADRVVMPGVRSNPYPWIASADATILTSDFEGMPMVLLESLACRTPIIASDCPAGGVSEIMGSELKSFMFPVGDADALADRIRKFERQRPEISGTLLDGHRMSDAVGRLEQFASHLAASQP